MIKIYPRVWAEVNLENIEHNVKEIKKKISDKCLFMAVVKANAYGHGAKEVAKAALKAGADRLGVATVDETEELRRAGIKAPIHILTGFEVKQAPKIAKLNLIPTVYNEEQINALSKFKKQIKVHVKVDTGMGRLGLSPPELIDFLKKIKSKKNLSVEGIFTHFAIADEKDNKYTKRQFKEFTNAIRNASEEGYIFKINHAANSAATILFAPSRLQMVRIGIALYGLHPSDETKTKIKLKPALSLHSRLSFVKKYKEGDSVSYGATYTMKKDGYVGTVPVGYADGYSRVLSNKTKVLVDNKQATQIGRICMDQFMVLLNNSRSKIGDKVTLIGKQGREEISADDIAKKLDTINYEVVCSINKRVPRYYESI